LIKNLHALHLDEWRFQKIKGLIENLEKNQFSAVGRTVRALGADSLRGLELYLIYEVLAKFFEKNLFRADSPCVFRDRPKLTSK
jgi:hypothetical protein